MLKFHRVHETTKANCVESHRYLTQNVKDGKFLSLQMQNRHVGGRHPDLCRGEALGNLFIGQFFFDDEPVDFDLFIRQAEKYGFR